MQFDDRLATVLRFRADAAVTRRIQLRQLLDLLGTSPSEARGEMLDAAYGRLAELNCEVPEAERAAMIESSGLRLRSPRLVATLAQDSPRIAAAALHQAQLSDEEWIDLVPALPVAVRGFVKLRQDLTPTVAAQLAQLGVHHRALPASNTQSATPPSSDAMDGIGAIVRRIEAFRKNKVDAAPPPTTDSPLLPLGEEHVLHLPAQAQAFDFETDAAGLLNWSDPGVAPMVIGLTLAPLSRDLREALRYRQPMRAVRIELNGARAICGQWQVDAAPSFDPVGGRFIGYRGRMRRLAAREGDEPTALPATDSAPDKMRQILHELRTPVNAIQGFAEVIQQQLFGPTPHEYRALAAAIAGDAARMLAAFDELDRLAKLESRAMELAAGECDFGAIVLATARQLDGHTRQRSSGFDIRADADLPLIALAAAEGERIAWRLLATLAGAAAPGERLRLRLRRRDRYLRLSVDLPASLNRRKDNALFETAVNAIPQTICAGVFGVGFALRLARAEALAAGGTLSRKDDRLRLDLPSLTGSRLGHSQETTSRNLG